jgi:hypothetical protein
VRDEEEREAALLHAAQGREELVHLLRHEHRGRLVEDDHLGAAVQHLQDLHALPIGDAEPFHQHAGVDAQARVAREFEDPLARLGPDAVQRFGAEHDVLLDGQVVGQHEVLVHHADPGLDRVRRGAEVDALAHHLDGALVGLLHPVEDLHQGGLARAVLTAQGVDFADSDAQVDVAVGDDARKALGDAGQHDGGRTFGIPDGHRQVGGGGTAHR